MTEKGTRSLRKLYLEDIIALLDKFETSSDQRKWLKAFREKYLFE